MLGIPKTAVIGAQGFIGSACYQYLRSQYPDTIATHHSRSNKFTFLDLRVPTFDFAFEGYRYALITAGIGNPTKCEEDPKLSFQINVLGTLEFGKFLLKNGVTPVFFSTDYVFDGVEKSYSTNSPHCPLNEYGRQKAELEKEASTLDALVIRLSKVYGLEKGDGTLFDEMASQLVQGKTIKAASDQIFSPVCIHDVVEEIVSALKEGRRGLINIAGKSCASRFEMALMVAEKLKVNRALVKEIKLDELGSSFTRPKKVILESSFSGMCWEEGIKKIVEQYNNG